jgi:hypothetical protein
MDLNGFPAPNCPALNKLLARANRKAKSGTVDALRYALFKYALPDHLDRPDGWLSYQVDTGAVPNGVVLRADPVHLRADQHRLVLFTADQLNITPEEARALAESFNQLYAADAMQLEAPTSTRWYLRLTESPALRTTPLAQVAGCDIDKHLPTGPDAQHWRRFSNEVQMLFHDHPVNRAREAKGKPLINSLWLWGVGKPVAPVAQTWQRVWTADIVTQGLARLNSLRCSVPPEDAANWLAQVVGDEHLLTLENVQISVAYADVEDWYAAVEDFELRWFAPLLSALGQGRLSELRVLTANGHEYRVTRWDLLRLWRTVRPLPSVALSK